MERGADRWQSPGGGIPRETDTFINFCTSDPRCHGIRSGSISEQVAGRTDELQQRGKPSQRRRVRQIPHPTVMAR